jgi:type IV pilus assembly protein PilQ
MRLSGALSPPTAFFGAVALAGVVVLAGSGTTRLVGVSAHSDDNGQTVLIESTDPVAYVVSRPDPLTVLVDLRGVSIDGAVNRTTEAPTGPVRSVHVEEAQTPDGANVARVRMDLVEPTVHRVRSTRNTIRVEFAGDGAAESAEPTMAAAQASAPSAARASTLTSVRTSVEGGRAKVTLAGNGRLEPARVFLTEDPPSRLVLDFADVEPAAPAQTAGAGDPVGAVRVALNSRDPLVTRVVVDLARIAPYHIERAGADGRDLALVFDQAALTPTAAPAGAPARSTAAVTRSLTSVAPTLTLDPMSALAAPQPPARAAPAASVAAPAPAAPRPSAQAPSGQAAQPLPVTQAPAAPSQRYTGHPVTLDFQDADLRAVLRTFAEISQLNMVIDPAVAGTVDVVLTEVPWDQALDIILRGSKLGYTVDGTVVRIAPLAVLADEEAARRKLSEEQALAGELNVSTRGLSYAKAAALAPLITRAALSPRGEVQVDDRTNTLIIRDLTANLTTADQLISELDRPEPQVEIEARIVQTNRDFARALGVQWGFAGRVQPDLGNTTGLAFPNRGVLDGRTGLIQGPRDVRSNALEATSNTVNLGVSGATSAVGLLLSSINGSFNLDVALSALEKSGKGRILSTPRVTTQNNQPAEMTQGIQIPIQTIANNTVTVTFKDAALTLKVTPQITASDTVIMRVELENSAADFSKAVTGIPPINTQRAITQVQVTDGATTVIGGIFTSTEQETNDRTPFLHRIPLLGWLFRRDTTTDESRELLIFITPRIMRG